MEDQETKVLKLEDWKDQNGIFQTEDGLNVAVYSIGDKWGAFLVFDDEGVIHQAFAKIGGKIEDCTEEAKISREKYLRESISRIMGFRL